MHLSLRERLIKISFRLISRVKTPSRGRVIVLKWQKSTFTIGNPWQKWGHVRTVATKYLFPLLTVLVTVDTGALGGWSGHTDDGGACVPTLLHTLLSSLWPGHCQTRDTSPGTTLTTPEREREREGEKIVARKYIHNVVLIKTLLHSHTLIYCVGRMYSSSCWCFVLRFKSGVWIPSCVRARTLWLIQSNKREVI